MFPLKNLARKVKLEIMWLLIHKMPVLITWFIRDLATSNYKQWIYTFLWNVFLLLLISMLWHRQAIFESKGDQLSSSAECMIWTQGLRRQITSRVNARWQTDWAIEDQAKKLELDSPSLWSANIQPTRPHCQLAFAPGSGDIHVWCCCCCLLRVTFYDHENILVSQIH